MCAILADRGPAFLNRFHNHVRRLACLVLTSLVVPLAPALERTDTEFRIFQFPRTMMPRIDGDPSDWDIVPDDYAIGADQLKDTVFNKTVPPEDFDCTVKVGWVKGLNRLYFLYEATDNYWDFERLNLRNDIFEVVVDGDMSGGRFVPQRQDGDLLGEWDMYRRFQGVHAQNYHIFTPPGDKAWAMVWGCQPWIAEMPWANSAYSYDFKHGESGKLVLEFWITPFDYAAYEGPARSVPSRLEENGLIGLSWAVLDYDGGDRYESFLNLSHKTSMCVDASDLVAFRLMPLEKSFRRPLEAAWSFTVADLDRRVVAFHDESYGNITSWKWDFGDGNTSTEQHPVHRYEKGGRTIIVVLEVSGPDGTARHARIWDVALP